VFQAGRFGNNLFQLAAALSFQDQIQFKDLKRNHIKILWHGYNPEIEKICKLFGIPVQFKRNRLIELLIAGPVSLQDRNIFVRAIYSLWWKFEKFNKTEICTTDEFLGTRDFKKNRFVLNGYFHNYSSATALINKFTNVNMLLLSCSDELKGEIESLKVKYIGVHLRFGDYLSSENRKSLGELGVDYYSKGVKMLCPSDEPHQLLIFSDDPSAAHLKLSSLKNCELKFAKDYCENSFDEFVLLSLLNRKILSNSTFSWWAGYFSNGSSQVVAPNPLSLEQMRGFANSPRFTYVSNKY